VGLQAERVKTLVELAAQSKYFYVPLASYSIEAQAKLVAQAVPLLESIKQGLADIVWLEEEIAALLKVTVKQHAIKFPQLAQPLRAALTGSLVSPAIAATIYLLGKSAVQERIEQALLWIER
jgi:glutamyl-tRNA synthetase